MGHASVPKRLGSGFKVTESGPTESEAKGTVRFGVARKDLGPFEVSGGQGMINEAVGSDGNGGGMHYAWDLERTGLYA